MRSHVLAARAVLLASHLASQGDGREDDASAAPDPKGQAS